MNRRVSRSLTSAALLLAVATLPVPAAAKEPQPHVRRVAKPGSDKEVHRDVIVERLGPHGELLGGPRGFLGVGTLPLTKELRTHFGVPEESGVLVASVEAGSPADKAGIRVGDVLTRVDGEAIEGPHDLRAALRDAEDGQAATVELWRDGKAQTVTANLERRERAELDLAPFFIREGGPGERMMLKIDPEKMGRLGEQFEMELKPGAHPGLLRLRSHEAELEKRLAELEKRIKELEKQLEK
ncbi:MAG TPA: PDZ domain-containing protein [Thermoanaerobaculia bacterium]